MQPHSVDRNALREQGWSDDGIDNALRAGSLVSVTRGSLVRGPEATSLVNRASAALATQRLDAAISHRHAALLLGYPWAPAAWLDPTAAIDLTVNRDDLTRSARHGLNRRIAALPEEDVLRQGGLRVTTPARTAVDLARTERELLAIQFMDWALAEGTTTIDQMRAVATSMVRVPGVRRAKAAIELARPGVDSPQETAARLQIVHAGLPCPDVRLALEEAGVLLARGDLGYWRWLIWIEYDGWEWHSSRDMFGSDRHRDRWLARRGWEVLRITKRDLAAPRDWLEQLRRAIDDAPARIAAMSPTRSPEVALAQHSAQRS